MDHARRSSSFVDVSKDLFEFIFKVVEFSKDFVGFLVIGFPFQEPRYVWLKPRKCVSSEVGRSEHDLLGVITELLWVKVECYGDLSQVGAELGTLAIVVIDLDLISN